MYSELYPEQEGKSRKLRGFALSLVGSFVFMMSSVGTAALASQWLYLAFAGLSLSAVGLIYMAHKSHAFLSQVILLISASGTLAAEAALVSLYFPVPLAGACAILTLGGSLVAARGIHDVESMAKMEPLPAKRRRELTVEQQTGGE
jgi:hypothetical protein